MLKNANVSPTERENIVKSNTSPKETANFKVNTSPRDKHNVHNKMNSSPKELGSKLFERVNVHFGHEEVEGDPRQAVSPERKKTAGRESSAVKSDGNASQVKHVGLLNLVRQRSPEGKPQQVRKLS